MALGFGQFISPITPLGNPIGEALTAMISDTQEDERAREAMQRHRDRQGYNFATLDERQRQFDTREQRARDEMAAAEQAAARKRALEARLRAKKAINAYNAALASGNPAAIEAARANALMSGVDVSELRSPQSPQAPPQPPQEPAGPEAYPGMDLLEEMDTLGTRVLPPAPPMSVPAELGLLGAPEGPLSPERQEEYDLETLQSMGEAPQENIVYDPSAGPFSAIPSVVPETDGQPTESEIDGLLAQYQGTQLPLVDPDQATSDRVRSARGFIEEFVEEARGYEKPVLDAATEAAERMVEAGLIEPEEAGKHAADMAMKIIESRRKKDRPVGLGGMRGGGGGTSRFERKDARIEARDLEKTYDLVRWTQTYRGLREAKSALDRNNGIVSKQVMFALAKANDKGKLSDQDFQMSVGGADIATRIMSLWKGWIEGDISDEEKKRIKGALTSHLAKSENILLQGRDAYRHLIEDPTWQPNIQDYLRGRGVRLFSGIGLPGEGLAPPPRSGSGSFESAGESEEEFMKKLDAVREQLGL